MIASLRQAPHGHFWLFALCLAVLTPLSCWTLGFGPGFLIGFDAAALIFLASAFVSMRDTDAKTMRERAELNDGKPIYLIGITLAVLAIILIAVTVETNGSGGPAETKIVPLITLAITWFFSNVVFTLHYAHLYYRGADGGDAGGISLPDGGMPTYIDFCYFSFIIGMTFQVSDIAITSRDIRSLALVHSMIAFFFNVGVIALSVNIVAAN